MWGALVSFLLHVSKQDFFEVKPSYSTVEPALSLGAGWQPPRFSFWLKVWEKALLNSLCSHHAGALGRLQEEAGAALGLPG